VFPSPTRTVDQLGLYDVFVPDGRFDSGASRTNRKEAERVVDLVFEHMRSTRDNQSLGVVTLSAVQAELIENLINIRKQSEPDIAYRFGEGVQDYFFVKNLEKVQGDERDHIILSIGYGPTVGTGKAVNRFGPINSPMGTRRLNVAITRAREKLTLVRSLQASDITSEAAGARLLKLFIDYAQDPIRYFEKQVSASADAEPDSTFEVAVKNALEARGYKVQPQVGVSGYRIDLALVSDDELFYDLGIECDGINYHSSPSARDRDWLRQQILEELGWDIHRIWSTSWIRNPEQELNRLETALQLARKKRVRPSVPA
jgi:very-short-patch-repair endonuclease